MHMLAGVSAGQIGISVGAGFAAVLIVVAVLIVIGARAHVRFRSWATGIGAACIGLLIGLSAADLLITGLGRWWANRPIAAATVTGLLLLAVTVLVVQALLDNLEARRFAPGGRAAVREIPDIADRKGYLGKGLAAVYDEMAAARTAGEPPGEVFRYRWGWMPYEGGHYNNFSNFVRHTLIVYEEIKQAITAQVPVLTATETLNDLYNLALNSADDVGTLATQLEKYNDVMSEEAAADRVKDPNMGPPQRPNMHAVQWHPKGAPVGQCWGSAIAAWNNVVAGLDTLEERASREFPGFDKHQKAEWRQKLPVPGHVPPPPETIR